MFVSLFIFIVGLIIGLGAVTVIDIHGFLGRKSNYWTEATTRAHKVTKPLIWLGTLLALFGGVWFYSQSGDTFYCKLSGKDLSMVYFHIASFGILILNGLFLTFGVSRFLLQREKEGKSAELLPQAWQNKIIASFVLSFVGWWLTVAMLVLNLIK
jgi:hypothetical protein